MNHFANWARTNPKRAASTLNKLQRHGTLEVSSDIQSLFEVSGIAFPSHVGNDFAGRWLRGSSVGATVVLGLAAYAAAGVDLVTEDHARIEESEPVRVMYGNQTAAQKRMRPDAKALGLHPRSSYDRWRTCMAWVECEHLCGASLTKWLKAKGKDFELKGSASRRFEKLELALKIRGKRHSE